MTGLRRSLFYQPLAILMSILLLPVVSWMEGGGAGPRAFQSAAQTISGCDADVSSKSIIRKYCVNGVPYGPDLVQLETDAVNVYLAGHGLPASDAHVIYDLGRSDLRSAIRGNMFVILRGIIGKPATSRTDHEKQLYNWFSAIVQQNEIALYTTAVNEFHRWQSDPCHFTLDPVIASAYSLSYDGAPYCDRLFTQVLNGPPVPAASYFRAYGLMKSYGAPAEQFPYFSSLVTQTRVKTAEVLGIAGGVAAAITISLGVAIGATFAAGIGGSAAGAVGLLTITELGDAFIIAGPAAIILIAIEIGVQTALEVYQRQQSLNDLNSMTNTLNQVKSAPPDLFAFASDSGGLGAYKLQMSLVGQTVPEGASSATLPAHQNGVDMNFAIQNGTSPTTTVSPTLSYNDWGGNTWSAQTWGGWFVQSCSGTNCSQAASILSSIEYIDWTGVQWTASRFGTKFVLLKAQPASTDLICRADNATGVTPESAATGPDFSNCLSYVSTSIPLTDSNGNHVRVSLSLLAPPVFTSPSTVPFAPGVSSFQTITATGSPTPTVCFSSGSVPSGFTLNGGSCGQGSFQVKYDGSTVPQGLYNLTLTATGYGTPVTKTFTIYVTQQLSITSADTFTTPAGVPVSFLVTTTGYPAPSLSMDPAFPLNGLTFTDNRDGTATISGTLTVLGWFTCGKIVTGASPAPCGIIASNSQGTVEQAFTINTSLAPQANVVPPTSATFIAGIPNRVVLSAAGNITPLTTWGFNTGNAPWASLQFNVFDGTAALSGAPPVGATGSFTVNVAPFALYSASDVSLLGYTPYTINVLNIPVFTSPNTAAFTAGTSGSFPVSVNMGTLSLADTLPNGLSFSAGNPGSINGVAAAGTGGQYTVRLIDDAGTAGSTTQYLNVNVYEGPQITSPNTATFIAGTQGSFAVTTTGFPNISTHPVSPTSLPPTSPTQGNGMYFTVTGLPGGLQASNLTPQGLAGGTLTIQGTPSAADAGPHQVQVTVQNGVGTIAQQTLTLNIIQITAPAPVSGTTCNGTYNGTFTGSITVSAGQNCAFIAGGVSGNVTANGGNVALTNANVTGSIAIQGPSAFSIGPGTTVGGNLTVQNIASGSTISRICQAKVGGNLEVYTNAIPISIGSPQTFCYGNSVGGNVDVQGNTAPIAVYDNVVGKNLSCSQNTSITGAGNSALKKNGQCAAF
jgi:hypothetical protein